MNASREEAKQAAEEFRRAAEEFGNKVFGPETQSHLKRAASHLCSAARSVIDETERRFTGGGGPASSEGSGSAEASSGARATSAKSS